MDMHNAPVCKFLCGSNTARRSVPVEERLNADWKCLTVSATPTNANIQTVRKKRGVIAVAETQESRVQANAD